MDINEMVHLDNIQDLVAAYEEAFKIPYENRVTYWFGDLALHTFKDVAYKPVPDGKPIVCEMREGVLAAVKAQIEKATATLGFTPKQYRDVATQYSDDKKICREMCLKNGMPIPEHAQSLGDKAQAAQSLLKCNNNNQIKSPARKPTIER